MRALLVSLALLFSFSAQSQHSWLITSDADAGPGSFRSALEEANALCTAPQTSCSITFFDHPEALPKNIGILTALPPITACNLAIRSQQRPPDLPDFTWGISSNGIDAEGLVLVPRCEGSRIEIDGFSIGGFRRDAIAIPAPVEARYVFNRLDLSGHSRGLAVDSSRATVRLSRSTIGNTGRSAVTIWSAAFTEIENVGIGIGRADTFARPIGASGLFLGAQAGDVLVRNTRIARSAHFGLALARGNAIIRLENSRIFNNAMAIDWGLDGPTPNAFDDVPDTPRVLDAVYDAARNVTRITVDPAGGNRERSRIEVWASPRVTNTGTAELDQFVGGADVTADSPIAIEVNGDLRGRHLSALRVELTRISELSPAVTVR